MKIFTSLYDWTMKVSRHKYSAYYLSFMSFAESVFFPVPVDVMLAPMALAKPKSAWNYAFLATVFSVLGGMIGYYLGYAMYDSFVVGIIESHQQCVINNVNYHHNCIVNNIDSHHNYIVLVVYFCLLVSHLENFKVGRRKYLLAVSGKIDSPKNPKL